MKLLLDTHTFLWLDSEPNKLSPKVQGLCRDKSHILLLSLVSIWEMQIKWQMGKLKLNQSLQKKIETQQQVNQLHILHITLEHVMALNQLPFHHRDPFDRLIIAQSMVEQHPLITVDSAFAAYPIQTMW